VVYTEFKVSEKTTVTEKQTVAMTSALYLSNKEIRECTQ